METEELYRIYLKNPSVQTDTRKLKENDMFFALSGPNFDGNTFAAQALEKRAAVAVIDNVQYKTDERCIVVPDVLKALQQLATWHRMQFKIPFLAITGSNGKTTTKELIAAVLSRKFVTYATEGNLNNHIGVPLTILKIKPDAGFAIIEMGANHQREIAGYCEVARPDYGLITNCGKAHIEGFGGEEGVRKGKGELYDFLRATGGSIFRNSDLDYLEQMAHGIEKQITYGTADADYCGKPVTNGVFIGVEFQQGGDTQVMETQLVGDYNFPNILAGIAIGLHFGVPMADIKDALRAYHPDNSRSQWLKKGTNQIILDAYNANPSSMKAAILNFAATTLPNKILWLGGMKEMGDSERDEHTQLVTLINNYEWQQVILAGKEFEGLQGKYLWFESSVLAADYIRHHQPANSSILLKGSRGSKMELMLDAL